MFKLLALDVRPSDGSDISIAPGRIYLHVGILGIRYKVLYLKRVHSIMRSSFAKLSAPILRSANLG